MKTTLEVWSSVLGFSTLFGVALASIWFALYMTVGCSSFQLFELSPHECGVITYSGIGLVKLLTYTLFLGPWIAVKLEVRRQKRK